METLGDKSYSIYLVHMPLIYLIDQNFFIDTVPGSFKNYLRICCDLLGTLAFGLLMYYKIENRYRNRFQRKSPIKILAILSFFPGVSILICVLVFTTLLPDYGNNRDLLGIRGDSAAKKQDCINSGLIIDKCTWHQSGQGRVLLVGDSQAWSYSDGVLAATKQLNLGLTISSMDHCLFIGNPNSFLIDSKLPTCSKWQVDVLNYLKETKPDVVIIANRGDGWIKPGFGEPIDSKGRIVIDSDLLLAEYKKT